MKLTIVSSSRGRRVDGVRDHAVMLAQALRDAGHDVMVADRVRSGFALEPRERVTGSTIASLISRIEESDWVVFEYSPFGLGRWGFAPWAMAMALWSSRRARLMVYVHEPYLEHGIGRRRLISLWQRHQLAVVVSSAASAAATIGQWRDQLAERNPGLPVAHIPVGSNLPDRRNCRRTRREALGGSDRLFIGTFSTGHDSVLDEHVTAAVARIEREHGPCIVLRLGSGTRQLALEAEVVSPGWLEAGVLAEYIAAADLILAPLVDGVSTRRSAVAAALQHGVPVVTTDGHLTDDCLRVASGMVLVPVHEVHTFARAAARLAGDRPARRALAAEARQAYETTWDWAAGSRRLIDVLAEAEQ